MTAPVRATVGSRRFLGAGNPGVVCTALQRVGYSHLPLVWGAVLHNQNSLPRAGHFSPLIRALGRPARPENALAVIRKFYSLPTVYYAGCVINALAVIRKFYSLTWYMKGNAYGTICCISMLVFAGLVCANFPSGSQIGTAGGVAKRLLFKLCLQEVLGCA